MARVGPQAIGEDPILIMLANSCVIRSTDWNHRSGFVIKNVYVLLTSPYYVFYCHKPPLPQPSQHRKMNNKCYQSSYIHKFHGSVIVSQRQQDVEQVINTHIQFDLILAVHVDKLYNKTNEMLFL